MANYDRNRSPSDEDDRARRSGRSTEENRGAFGYEGEGYMRSGGRDIENRWRSDYFGDREYDIRWDEERRYRGAGYGSEPGYRGAGYLGGSYGGGYAPERGVEPAYEVEYQRPSFRGRGPKNYQRSDERIREDVCERLEQDERVDASEIEVIVANGVVTLTGSIDDRASKRRAEDVAESVSGVKDVQNQIRIARE